MTAYYSLTMDETLETGQKLLEDLFKNPLMAEEHIELERGVIKQELNNVINDPDMYIRRLLMRSHFGEHPLALPILGSEATVDSFSKEALLQYHRDHYRPPNVAVVVAGNVNGDDILAWASRCFDNEAVGSRPDGTNPPETPFHHRHLSSQRGPHLRRLRPPRPGCEQRADVGAGRSVHHSKRRIELEVEPPHTRGGGLGLFDQHVPDTICGLWHGGHVLLHHQ